MKLMGQLLFAPTGITIIPRTIARLMATGDRTISLMASSSARARGFMAIMADVASMVGGAITAEAILDVATMDAAVVSGEAEDLKVAASEAIEAATSAGSTAEVEMASAATVEAGSAAIVADSTAIMEAVSVAAEVAGSTVAVVGLMAEAVPTEVAAAIGNS